jgi:hypothetical protein
MTRISLPSMPIPWCLTKDGSTISHESTRRSSIRTAHLALSGGTNGVVVRARHYLVPKGRRRTGYSNDAGDPQAERDNRRLPERHWQCAPDGLRPHDDARNARDPFPRTQPLRSTFAVLEFLLASPISRKMTWCRRPERQCCRPSCCTWP